MKISGSISQISMASPELQEVLALDLSDFPRPWAKEDWVSLNWQHHHLYIYKVQDSFCGFALFARVPGDNTAHLLKICLKEAMRGSEVSKEFWSGLCHELKFKNVKSIYLEVEASNHRARAFYQKSGLQTLRVIKAYYSDGEDAYTMELTL